MPYSPGLFSGIFLVRTSDLNPSDDFIPLKSGYGYVDSALQETATKIISSKTIEAPSNSFNIGVNTKLSDRAGFPASSPIAFGDTDFDKVFSSSALWETYSYNQIPLYNSDIQYVVFCLLLKQHCKCSIISV